MSSDPVVESITIFPVKSCHYVQVQECQVDNLGIKHDRRFMIVDEQTNRFVSQRVFPSLAMLKANIDEEANTLTLSAENQQDFVLPLKQELKTLKKRNVKLWSDITTVYDVGDQVAEWIQQFLINHRDHDYQNNYNADREKPIDPVRLVTVEDPKEGVYHRPVHPKLKGVHVAFNDWSPITFGFESSMEQVNKGLLETGFSKGNQINLGRFRSNIAIKGTEPWEEDQWLVVKIGQVTCYIIQPIYRCTIPSIDQDTGVKDNWDKRTPSDYLRLTREFKDEPGRGQFCVDVAPLTSGKICVGDKVHVLERIPEKFKQKPLPPKIQ